MYFLPHYPVNSSSTRTRRNASALNALGEMCEYSSISSFCPSYIPGLTEASHACTGPVYRSTTDIRYEFLYRPHVLRQNEWRERGLPYAMYYPRAAGRVPRTALKWMLRLISDIPSPVVAKGKKRGPTRNNGASSSSRSSRRSSGPSKLSAALRCLSGSYCCAVFSPPKQLAMKKPGERPTRAAGVSLLSLVKRPKRKTPPQPYHTGAVCDPLYVMRQHIRVPRLLYSALHRTRTHAGHGRRDC